MYDLEENFYLYLVGCLVSCIFSLMAGNQTIWVIFHTVFSWLYVFYEIGCQFGDIIGWLISL